MYGKHRSSRPNVFCKKGVLRYFTKFTGKHLSQSLFCNFIKKETLAQVFSSEFCEISKNTFFIEHLWWVLLKARISQITNSTKISQIFRAITTHSCKFEINASHVVKFPYFFIYFTKQSNVQTSFISKKIRRKIKTPSHPFQIVF